MRSFFDMISARQNPAELFHQTTSGTDGDDTIVSHHQSEWLSGGKGRDTLFASDEGSHMYGGADDDIFYAGKGADSINGGPGNDEVRYSNSDQGVYVDLVYPSNNGGDAKGDTFASIENVTGSSHGDYLLGDGANNTLRGLSGDDYLEGRAGNDDLYGGSGNDKLRGGADADTFHFDRSSEGSHGIIIRDFESGVDKIDLSKTLGHVVTENPNINGGWHLSYDYAKHEATLDLQKSGSASGTTIHLEHIDHPLTNDDFIV